MKLKFVQNLNEANIARGQRLLKLKEINAQIKSAVEAAGYGFKDQNDVGFYILPKKDFIAIISLDKIKDENAYIVTAFDALSKEHSDLRKKLVWDDDVKFSDTLKNAIISETLKKIIFQITPEDITKLQAPVSEALPKSLQTIITNIKAAADAGAASRTEKKQDKLSAKLGDEQSKTTDSRLNELVLNAAKKALAEIKADKIKVKVENEDGHVDIIFMSNIIAGVNYDTQVETNTLKVKKCVTASGETDVSCSLAAFLNFIRRKLGVDIDIRKFPELLKLTGSTPAEVKAINGFEANVKASLDDEILSKLGEDLDLTEDIIKPDTSKYDDALQLVKTDTQGQALVKLYFYKESGKKLQLTDYQARDLWKVIKTAKSFSKDKSSIINIFVNYYNLHQSSSSIQEELKNLVTILTDDNFGSEVGNVGRDSLIFNKAFIMNPVTTEVTRDIYTRYLRVLSDITKGVDTDMAEKIKNVVRGIIIPKIEDLANARSIANFMIFTDSKTKAAIRDIKDIKAIYDALMNGSPDKPKSAAAYTTKSVPDDALKSLNKDQAALIADTFKTTETEGAAVVDELIDNIRKSGKSAELKKILDQLFKRL